MALQARVEPSQGLVSAICEGTRELHLEATQVLGIASKHPGNLTEIRCAEPRKQ
jgi:hypothetical protein